ncbi:MAG: DUF1552 domain-containing protein [Polyangiaceae bacterium]|nr:DUF1552 domain-containing protein [Polyangiaceae bacterium]
MIERGRRRRFLRGLGGVGLALPFLEIFAPKRVSAAPGDKPNRYVFAFGGASIGMDGGERTSPPELGPIDASNTSRATQPLVDLGVNDVASVVSGLKIPWGSTPPTGGRAIGFHASSTCPLASGMRSLGEDDESLGGPTSDWVVADTIAADIANKVFATRVQAAFYRGSNGTGGQRGLLSARMNDGQLEEVPPTSSPKVAFESITTGFIPPDPEEAEFAKRLLERRKSVIDLVRGDTEKLVPRLGAADKIRLERHLDELRGLELRLNAITPPASPSCVMPGDPGDDPSIGGAVENGEQGEGGGYDSMAAYSNEELRAQVMVDLIHFAFACDLYRVANLMFTYSQCFLNVNPILGYPSDLHEISHFSMGGGQDGQDAVADCIGWHVKHWATLMKKLRDTEDNDGTSILDSTSMILCFEGGVGYDPEQDAQGSPHSTENMIVMIGGKAGGLHTSPGRHIRKEGDHPTKVINTAMRAVGGPDQLGEVSGSYDELFA